MPSDSAETSSASRTCARSVSPEPISPTIRRRQRPDERPHSELALSLPRGDAPRTQPASGTPEVLEETSRASLAARRWNGRCTRAPARRGRPGRRSGGRGLQLTHVLGHDLHRPAELLRWAELDHLRPRIEDRSVSRADVVRLTGHEDLFSVSGAKGDLPFDDVAHVLALALVVRKPLEHGGQVGVLGVGLEANGPAAIEVLEVAFVTLD